MGIHATIFVYIFHIPFLQHHIFRFINHQILQKPFTQLNHVDYCYYYYCKWIKNSTSTQFLRPPRARRSSNGKSVGHRRIHHSGRVSHDTATLHVAKAVYQSPHRPLHDGGDCEGQEPQRRAHHLAAAGVGVGAALDAKGDSNSGSHSIIGEARDWWSKKMKRTACVTN